MRNQTDIPRYVGKVLDPEFPPFAPSPWEANSTRVRRLPQEVRANTPR